MRGAGFAAGLYRMVGLRFVVAFGILIALPRGAVKFNCHSDSSSHTGNHAKEKPQPNLSDTEYDRVRHRSRQQTQRPVPAMLTLASK